MGLRAQLGWIRHGAARTNTTLEAYGTELRALQEKVEALVGVAARLDEAVAHLRADGAADRANAAHLAAGIDAMKGQLREVTDDLGDRIGALTDRLDSV